MYDDRVALTPPPSRLPDLYPIIPRPGDVRALGLRATRTAGSRAFVLAAGCESSISCVSALYAVLYRARDSLPVAEILNRPAGEWTTRAPRQNRVYLFPAQSHHQVGRTRTHSSVLTRTRRRLLIGYRPQGATNLEVGSPTPRHWSIGPGASNERTRHREETAK